MTTEDDAAQVLREHVKGQSCCHADRGPCVYDGTAVSQSNADTCMTCARSPWDKKPEWPCLPVRLARGVLGHDPSATTDGGSDD